MLYLIYGSLKMVHLNVELVWLLEAGMCGWGEMDNGNQTQSSKGE